jgi:hypothetical protein
LLVVDLPQQGVDEERKQLDERDAGVALIEVRPLWLVDGDPAYPSSRSLS